MMSQKRSKLFFCTWLAFGFSFLPFSAFAQDCASIIRDHLDWVRASSNKRLIAYTFVSNKIRDNSVSQWSDFGHAAFMEGYLENKGDELYSEDWKIFSNRSFPFSAKRDQLQAFAFDKADRVGLLLRANGTGEIKLLSWGNTILPIENIRCFRDNFGAHIQGMTREGNGTSTISISLHKVEAPSSNNFGTLTLKWAGVIDNGEAMAGMVPMAAFTS
ncbi:MAG: hypothetical protein ACRENG_30680 [bacterium]